jgi:hypothetical protein
MVIVFLLPATQWKSPPNRPSALVNENGLQYNEMSLISPSHEVVMLANRLSHLSILIKV